MEPEIFAGAVVGCVRGQTGPRRAGRTVPRDAAAVHVAGRVLCLVQGLSDDAGEARGAHAQRAVVLGNVGTASDAGALEAALADEEPLVRSHAAWALGELGAATSVAALESRTHGSAGALSRGSATK